MTALRLGGMLEHLGQLEGQLCQALASCGEVAEAKSDRDFSDGGLEEMSSSDTFNRVDNGVLKCGWVWMAGGLSLTELMKQTRDSGTFASGFRAIYDTVSTWCYVWLVEGQ